MKNKVRNVVKINSKPLLIFAASIFTSHFTHAALDTTSQIQIHSLVKSNRNLKQDLARGAVWNQRLALAQVGSPAGISVAQNGIGRIPASSKIKSDEWTQLPEQEWEKGWNTLATTSAPFPANGIDPRSIARKKLTTGYTLHTLIQSEALPILGEILYSRTESQFAAMGDTVFIRADNTLQVGNIYSITETPIPLTSGRDGRSGSQYQLLGKLKIIGVRDGNFIATIIQAVSPIPRNSWVIPEIANPVIPKAVATADTRVGQVVHADPTSSIVYVDLGKSDGVDAGSVLRHYLHTDPSTGQEITTRDFIIDGTLLVIRADSSFSAALILDSRKPFDLGDELVALSDISDLSRNYGLQTVRSESSNATTPDDLDIIDDTEGVGSMEDQELKELEQWDAEDVSRQNIRPGNTPAGLGDEPAPNDSGSTPTTAEEPAPVEESSPVEAPAETIEEAPTDAPTDAPAEAPPETSSAPLEEAPPAPTSDPIPQSSDTVLEGSDTSAPSDAPITEEGSIGDGEIPPPPQ